MFCEMNDLHFKKTKKQNQIKNISDIHIIQAFVLVVNVCLFAMSTMFLLMGCSKKKLEKCGLRALEVFN